MKSQLIWVPIFMMILILSSGCVFLSYRLNIAQSNVASLKSQNRALEIRLEALEKNNSALVNQLHVMSMYPDSVPLVGFKWVENNITIGLHGQAIPFMVYQGLGNAVSLWETSFTWFHDYYNLTIPYKLSWRNGTGDINIYWDTDRHLDSMFGHDTGLQVGITIVKTSPTVTRAILPNGTYASVSIAVSSDLETDTMGVWFIEDVFVHELGHALYLGDINQITENADEMSTKYAFMCPQISTLDLYGIWWQAIHPLSDNYTLISVSTTVPQSTVIVFGSTLYSLGNNDILVQMPITIPFTYSEVDLAEC